jgi:hypothetical protein
MRKATGAGSNSWHPFGVVIDHGDEDAVRLPDRPQRGRPAGDRRVGLRAAATAEMHE